MTAAQIIEAGSKTELMEEFDHAKNIMPISKDTFGKSYAIQNDTSNQESCDHITNYVKNTIAIYHPSSRQKQNIKKDKRKAKHIHRRRKKSVRQEVTGTTNLSPNEPVLQSPYTPPAKKNSISKKKTQSSEHKRPDWARKRLNTIRKACFRFSRRSFSTVRYPWG